MRLRTQILGFGMAGVLVSVIVGFVGITNAKRIETAFGATVQTSLLLSKCQDADMMHDAIRGDVMLSILHAQKSYDKGLAEADKTYAEHAQIFNSDIAEMESMALSDEARDALNKAKPLITSYLEIASKVQKVAHNDVADAEMKMSDVNKVFTELEAAMSSLSASIAKDVQAASIDTSTRVNRAIVLIFVGLLIGAGTLLLAGWWLSGYVSRPIEKAVQVSEQIALGNLTVQIEAEGNMESIRLLETMGRMQANFMSMVRSVKGSADLVAATSSEIAQGNHNLSVRTEQQAAAIEETNASMSDWGQAIKQNADAARQANQMATNASSIAIQGGTVVNHVVETMRDINSSSQKIADIISVIDGIAFQTNILALNAAVEAARAGEQGRGFAVVASEVRALAGRSAEAAKEIKTLISASVEKVEQGSTLVDQAGATMNEMVKAIQNVTDIMGSITTATSEQSAGMSQIGEAIGSMDHTTQQNAALVEQMAAAAASLNQQAQELVQTVGVFRLNT